MRFTRAQCCFSQLDEAFNLLLGDFSSSVHASPHLEDGVGIGSTQYCAPEIVKPPPSPFSFPIDIFAAGLTMLYMITAAEPYESLATSSSKVSRQPSLILKKRDSLSAKRGRSSSGAGKMVEMHMHLAKGHAWDWEEKRRLDELEDEVDGKGPIGGDRRIDRTVRLPRRPIDGVFMPDAINIPLWAVDADVHSDLPPQTYSDGYTPVQRFLLARGVVPEALRALIKQMLSPQAAARPSAKEALQLLEHIRQSPAC